MNGKNILVVIVAVILGAGVGLGLSYAMFQPLINNLQTANTQLQNTLTATQNSLMKINSTLNAMENRDFHLIYSRLQPSAASSNNVNSSILTIQGDIVRIRWRLDALAATGWIQIFLYYPNGSYATRGSSGLYGDFANEIEVFPGNYTIRIKTSSSIDAYSVYVWDYY